jgi:predicted ATPase/DNA-binding SARP family transcriptional activator
MAQLTITLLGTFGVTQDGIPVTQFGADTARLLLAYLAMHAGDSFDREVLADLLWPDRPRSEALHALRQALNRVRRAIGDRETESPFLCITRDTIQFNPDSDYWLDVTVFRSLIAATQQHSHRRLEACRACISQLEQAAELYQGDLLTGFFVDSHPFEEWLVMEREQLHRQALEVFYQLAAHYERSEQYEQARQYAWRQVELEAWREEAHQQLMRASALSGQRSAALAQYQRCCQILADEMGVEPAPETTALYEQIQAGKLETLKAQPHNLPIQLTPFVGRESELGEITEMLNLSACRLLTVLGTGGIGKTRLALRVAEEAGRAFKDGMGFVQLSAIDSPDLFVTAIAHSLQISFTGQEDPLTQISNYLREKELLLVLDSFEHLVTAAEQVTRLLQHVPHLTLLITSRERLSVQSEWLYEVKGLNCPSDETPQALDTDAVQLFVQSARRVCPDFLASADLKAVGQICRLVEGMPLAIELAASWTRTLSCPEIVQEIERDLDFLRTSLQDVPERHRSLRAVFDASWTLLTPQERTVLCRLSVFRGGLSRVAAEQVAQATPAVLAALADKSFIQQKTGDAPLARYELHDLLQRYAAEKLAQDPAADMETRDRHSRYYLSWLGQQEAGLKGAAQRETLEAIGLEIGNIRAAWDHAVQREQFAGLAHAIESLFLFYDRRSWFQEGRVAFEKVAWALREAQTTEDQVTLGKGQACQGWFMFQLAHGTPARELLEHSVARLRSLDARREMAFALNHLGAVMWSLSDFHAALGLCRDSLSLYRDLGDRWGEGQALIQLGLVYRDQSDHAQARFYYKQALQIYREIGHQQGEGQALRHLGLECWYQSDCIQARAYLEQALHIFCQVGDRLNEGETLYNLGLVSDWLGEGARAIDYLEQAIHISHEIGHRPSEGWALANLGITINYQGQHIKAKAYLEQALQIVRETGSRQKMASILDGLGDVFRFLGDYVQARSYYEQSLGLYHEIGNRQWEGGTLDSLSLISHNLGDDLAACEYGQQALLIAQEFDNRFAQGYVLTHLGHALTSLGQLEQATDAYQQALSIRRETNQHFLAMETLAGLARVSLAQKNPSQALAQVEEILSYLETHTLAGTDNPIEIYLTCYHVLCANQDPRASDILRTAHDLLQKQAADIDDEVLRRSFLENVAAHRAIVRDYQR